MSHFYTWSIIINSMIISFKTLSKNTISILESISSMEDPCFNHLAYVLTSNFAMLWIQVGILRALEGRSILTEGPVTAIPDQYFPRKTATDIPVSAQPPPHKCHSEWHTYTFFLPTESDDSFQKNVVTGPTPCFTELGKHILYGYIVGAWSSKTDVKTSVS